MARHHRDLESWQLAHQVRIAFLELTSRERVKTDFDFCDQARRASNSACKNTAEGFWRFGHKEFANFVNIAKGSLGELLDSTDEALAKRYVDQAEYDQLNQLVNRALRASTALHNYLISTPTPPRRQAKKPTQEPP